MSGQDDLLAFFTTADILRFVHKHPEALAALTERERRVWEARYGTQ